MSNLTDFFLTKGWMWSRPFNESTTYTIVYAGKYRLSAVGGGGSGGGSTGDGAPQAVSGGGA